MDLARILDLADALAGPGDELLRRDGGLGRQRDERDDLLAALWVGSADHPGHRHLGVLAQRVLDVPREDVEPAPDDEVLLAVDDVDVAVLVQVADVAGAQLAVDYGGGADVRTAPVA